MSLGYTRDSLADLHKFYNSNREDDDVMYTVAPKTSSNISSTSCSADDNDFDDFLFLDDEDHGAGERQYDVTVNLGCGEENSSVAVAAVAAVAAVPLRQTHPPVTAAKMKNQSSTESSITANTPTTTTTLSSSTPTEHPQQQFYDNIKINTSTTSATTKTLTRSYSTDSTKIYNNSSNSRTRHSSDNTEPNTYYSGFDYTSYETDYNFNQYMDPYAPSNSNLSLHQVKKDKNIFCCIFGNPYDGDSDSDSGYGSEDKDNDNDNNIIINNRDKDRTIEVDIENMINDDGQEENKQEDDLDSDISMDVSHHGIHDEDDLSLSKSTSYDIDESRPNGSMKTKSIGSKQQHPTTSISSPSSNLNIEAISNPSTPSNTIHNKATKITEQTGLEPKPLKGILKRIVTKPDAELQVNKNKVNISITNNQTNDSSRRRSILPSYETTKSFDESSSPKKAKRGSDSSTTTTPPVRKTVSFSPMARVVNVTARTEMTFFSRSLIWWQRNDYDDFKKTGRIISQAMLCGGSEIWLQTSNAWGKKLGGSPEKNSLKKDDRNGNSTTTTSGQNSEEHMNALKEYGVTTSTEDEKDNEDVGSKWWCRFGHSRRGLEHVVSIEEGRQRQRFVNIAVRAVLDEQRRQRITRKDPSKIAAVSMQYTSWARDLAIASGAADAEAVRSNFNSKAKCRIHHLRRGLNGKSAKPLSTNVQDVHVPSASFILSANSALTAKVLDANTDSSLRMQHMVKKKQSIVVEEEKKSSGAENEIAKKAAGFQF